MCDRQGDIAGEGADDSAATEELPIITQSTDDGDSCFLQEAHKLVKAVPRKPIRAY